MPKCTGLRFSNPVDFQPCAVGEPAYVNDLKIIASYDDGTEREVVVVYKMFNDSNMHITGDKRACFIIFEGQKLEFSIPILPCMLDHIEVEPLRDLKFSEGDMFNRENIRVTAFYDDGCSKEIATYKITPFAPLTPSQTEVTIKYGSQTKTLNITVVPRKSGIASVKIHKLPNKQQYLLNDTTVDLSGGKLQIEYLDGSHKLVDMTSDNEPLLESGRVGKGKVEFQYHGKGVYFFVDILAPVVQDVIIKHMPIKREYYEGDTLDLTGLVLCAKYNDGSEREIKNLDNGSFLLYSAHSQTGVNLTYLGHSFNIPVIVRKIEEKINMTQISLSTPPFKQRFVEGETLDFTGAQLMLQYSNGTREIVDVIPDMIKSGDCSKPGTTVVRIEYKGYSLEVPVLVHEKEIDHLEITNLPEKMEYIENEAVNVDGLTVMVCFDNGDTEEVTNYTVIPKIINLETNSIVIQYRDHQAEFPISVAPIAVKKLDWKSLPEKRNYYIYEKEFACFGGIIEAIYNTGEVESVQLTTSMISGFNTDQVGQYTIIVSYKGETLPFTITVQERVLLGIQIKQMPRTYYRAGEKFNPDGMKVETIYSGGSNEEVQFTFRPDRPLRPDDNFVVISYKDKAVVLDLVVTEPIPEPVPEPIPEPTPESVAEPEPECLPETNDTEFEIVNDSPGSEGIEFTDTPEEEPDLNKDNSYCNEDKTSSEIDTREKIEVPHFYPSTFCIRFD